MTKPKVIPKSKREDMFGITRFRDNHSWYIRLGYHTDSEGHKEPGFKVVIKDRDFNNDLRLSLKEAIRIRDRERPNYPKPEINPRVKNPVSRLSLKSSRNRTGHRYYAWGVSAPGAPRTFSFWRTGKIGEAFDAAVEYAVSRGVSIKETDMNKAFKSYLERVNTKEFRNFLNNKAII